MVVTPRANYDRQTRTFSLKDGRRPAGYVIATPGTRAFDDPGIFSLKPREPIPQRDCYRESATASPTSCP